MLRNTKLCEASFRTYTLAKLASRNGILLDSKIVYLNSFHILWICTGMRKCHSVQNNNSIEPGVTISVVMTPIKYRLKFVLI